MILLHLQQQAVLLVFYRDSACGDAGATTTLKVVLNRRRDSEDRLEASSPLGVPPLAQQLSPCGTTYVKLQPSKDLTILASTSDETIQAVKTLANALSHRWRFIGRYKTPQPSPGVHVVSFPASQCGGCPSGKHAENGAHTQSMKGCLSARGPCNCSVCDGEGTPMPFEAVSKEPHFEPFSVKVPPSCAAKFKFVDGVIQVFWKPGKDSEDLPLLWDANTIPTVREYLAALQDVMIAVQDPDLLSLYCYGRRPCSLDPGKKYRTEGNTVVAEEGGQGVTLRDLFDRELGFSAREASVDHLNVHALGSCFQRFDLFNQKYNPFGQARLRDVFLKTDNYIKGRFLAELTKEVIADLDDRKYQHAEWRVSIYGRSPDEWSRLAAWVVDNGLHSRRVRWLVQVPRLYHVYRKRGEVPDFGTLLRNVFEPLFEAVKNPEKHRKIYLFLQAMVGFDSVDDESRVSKYTMEGGELPSPSEWTSDNNPPYSYWAYYMYANIRALNLFLEARNMKTLSFRPHCGEAGSISHLAAAFLLADGINHGILLKGAPVLQYMFFLKQIGIAVSPLSNNALFVDIGKRDVHLSAHMHTLEKLAGNKILVSSPGVSGIRSGFEVEFKRHWLGDTFWLPGSEGNDMSRTNVSNIRLQYRIDTWREELENMREILNMRMALTATQQQQQPEAGVLNTFSLSLPPPSLILQMPRGASPADSPMASRGRNGTLPSSPGLVVDKVESSQGALTLLPAAASGSAISDLPSPKICVTSALPVILSPDLSLQKNDETRQRRRSVAEQELDELSCAAQQLALSMKMSLPQSQENDESS
ncbi:adenosine monophosphate [Cyclospora cayetanensis]|uniref:Adenosine monophosphate n=1 Tax=Cyclospora cayetanensis TaxID=88456 RepID=A0A1D3D1L8_9EIME|nr:adenosine monophosphate [Cyclospora cayetanensis]